MEGKIALQDGRIFKGTLFGREVKSAVGELVFNTSLYGYQEILTDPSYAGQIIVFTNPQIGNVGCNPDDEESRKVYATGCVVRDLSRITSNFRSRESLHSFLERQEVSGISDIDTRMLVNALRDNGACAAAIGTGSDEELAGSAAAFGDMTGKTYVREVSIDKAYSCREGIFELGKGFRKYSEEELGGRPHIVALDFGMKKNIARLLVSAGFRVTVVPAYSTAEEIAALSPDGIFLSNGPGDPAELKEIVAVVKQFLGSTPIFGICLGHQILGQAFGAETYKLKFGHRGGNHPVREEKTGKIEISVQNHGFAVDSAQLPKDVTVSHVNLNDGTVEGLCSPAAKAFSVQYHPEACPGPHDSGHLFKRFHNLVVSGSSALEV